MEHLLAREMRERDERREVREAGKHLAHFTIDDKPLCTFMAPAYADRMRAAGYPVCEDRASKQAAQFVKLAAQFPRRVALVHGACPHNAPRIGVE